MPEKGRLARPAGPGRRVRCRRLHPDAPRPAVRGAVRGWRTASGGHARPADRRSRVPRRNPGVRRKCRPVGEVLDFGDAGRGLGEPSDPGDPIAQVVGVERWAYHRAGVQQREPVPGFVEGGFDAHPQAGGGAGDQHGLHEGTQSEPELVVTGVEHAQCAGRIPADFEEVLAATQHHRLGVQHAGRPASQRLGAQYVVDPGHGVSIATFWLKRIAAALRSNASATLWLK